MLSERNHVVLLEIFEWCALFGKVHSLSITPEPLAVWNKELEGLVSIPFRRILNASSENIYPAAPRAYNPTTL